MRSAALLCEAGSGRTEEALQTVSAPTPGWLPELREVKQNFTHPKKQGIPTHACMSVGMNVCMHLLRDWLSQRGSIPICLDYDTSARILTQLGVVSCCI